MVLGNYVQFFFLNMTCGSIDEQPKKCETALEYTTYDNEKYTCPKDFKVDRLNYILEQTMLSGRIWFDCLWNIVCSAVLYILFRFFK